ncbi:Lrp/AsnC family transcriptional regulator [Nanoarchaeota archaeon]
MRQQKKTVELLMQLRKDGRQQLTDISRKINVPVSTLFDRVRISRGDLITRFTCLLDFQKVGFGCRAQMVFRVKKSDRDEMQMFLLKHPNVNSVYKINNGYDFLVEAVFRELKGVDEFVEKVDERYGVLEKKVYYIISDLGREMFLTDLVHAEMVGML